MRMLKVGGRLAIIDLAPHAHEYLRDEHAHVRLGFSHPVMAEWLGRQGLTVEDVIDLPPETAAGRGLTVTIWLARRMAANAETLQNQPLVLTGSR
jgi:hypothetical protein